MYADVYDFVIKKPPDCVIRRFLDFKLKIFYSSSEARYLSTSMAAIQPEPAAVIAWR